MTVTKVTVKNNVAMFFVSVFASILKELTETESAKIKRKNITINLLNTHSFIFSLYILLPYYCYQILDFIKIEIY